MSLLCQCSGFRGHCVAVTILFIMFSARAQGNVSQDSFSISQEPHWIERLSYDSAKSMTTTQPVQYLLVDYQTKIGASPYTEYNRYVSKALNSTGVEEVSQIKIAYNPSYQRLILHKVVLHRSNKTDDITHASKVRFLQREQRLEQKIQDGIVDALIDVAGTKIGDIVEYSYSIAGRNPIFGEKVFGSGPLSWGVAVDYFSFRLISDGRPLFFKTHGTNKQIEKIKKDRYVEYRYVDTDVESQFDEGDYPPYETPYAWYEYTEYRNWAEVNQWADELYRFGDDKNPNTKALASELAEKHIKLDEYVQASLAYVQNQIRYLGLEFGVNSHLPRSPDSVIANQYGDCKDKSVLFQKLLNEKQVTVYPALVSTAFREGVNDRLPSPGVFDHVINYVEFSGEHYWLDGTRSYQTGELGLLGKDDYGYALLVGHPSNSLKKMYAEGIPPDSITYDERLSADSFGDDVTYTVETKYSGNVAEYKRYQFDNMSLNDIQKKYLDMYRYYYQDIIDIKPMEFEDDRNKNVFTVREHYKIPNFWLKDGDAVISRVNILSFADVLREPEVRDRNSDFFLRKPINITHNYLLQYPEDVLLDLAGEGVDEVHDSFRFTATHSYDDRQYKYSGKLTTLKHVVSREHFSEYLSLIKQLKDQWYFSLSVADPERIYGFRELIALRKRLVELSGGEQ